jgi:lipopolysaccharide transport system ATP-binding protein
MNSVRNLCQRGLWLRTGELVADGPADQIVNQYLNTLSEHADQPLHERTNRRGNGRIKLTHVHLESQNGESRLVTGGPLNVIFGTSGFCQGLSCSFTIYDPVGQPVTFFDSSVYGQGDGQSDTADSMSCRIDELLLLPGRYRINAALECDGELLDHVEGAVFFDVEASPLRGRPTAEQGAYGSIQMPHYWTRPKAKGDA